MQFSYLFISQEILQVRIGHSQHVFPTFSTFLSLMIDVGDSTRTNWVVSNLPNLILTKSVPLFFLLQGCSNSTCSNAAGAGVFLFLMSNLAFQALFPKFVQEIMKHVRSNATSLSLKTFLPAGIMWCIFYRQQGAMVDGLIVAHIHLPLRLHYSTTCV